MERILIATDGSDAAHEAIELGVELAKHEGAEAIFVHAVPVTDLVAVNGFGLVGSVPHEPSHWDETVLEEAKDVAERECVPAGTALLRGDPAATIVAHAETIDADLVVVGSRGHGAVASALLGSVSRGVLARSKRPVLIVRAAPVRKPAAA